MGRKEKLIKELKKRPKTFAFADAESLLNYLDFVRSDKGRTSGSRIMFVSKTHDSILLHKPHLQKDLKTYQIKQLPDLLLKILLYQHILDIPLCFSN